MNGDEEALSSVFEPILARRLKGKHEDTDDEFTEELRFSILDDVVDEEVQISRMVIKQIMIFLT
uniref:Uncharacterized protein n=1 Tax=Chenopodium quinoa TaxID=63459 RepID=A0A803MXT8_CHEQI